MPRPPLRAVVLAALVAAGPALAAPDQGPAAFTARDPQIDAGLEKAAEKERQGDYSAAVRTYVEVEALLEKARAKGDERPVTEVGPGLDRGVGRYVRDRIAALPADARREYLQTVDPRAREALVRAMATRLPDELEAVLARYPLASIADRALPALAELALERGEVARAVRAWARLEARSTDADAARRAAWMRFLAAVLGRDRAAARSALASWTARGGDPAAPRRIGARELPPRTVLAELERTTEGGAGPAAVAAFDLGGTAASLPLVTPEIDDELVRKLGEPPTHQEPVVDPDARLVIVADELGVRAVPLPQPRAAGPVGPAAWSFSLKDEVGAPGRVEAAICRPALGPGRVYATLHRNRPARVSLKAVEKPRPNEPQQVEVERLRDWRVVALDRATGVLVWDAAERSEQPDDPFDAIARNAEWVSSPLHADGAVFVLVLERQSDLRASLVRLDDATGEVRWRSFLASRPAFDHLGLGAPPPPPALGPTGDVVVATGLGVVASVEPTRGEPTWVARYADTPESSQSALVDAERRFRATSPLVGRGADGARAPIVVAPVDGGEVIALDPETGETRWRAPRGGARTVVEAPSGDVLLVGARVVALERETGRVRFTGAALPGPAIAPPLVLGEEVVVVTRDGPAWSIARVALDGGALRGRWRLSASEVGAPLLAGGALTTVGPNRLTVWSTLAEEQKRIEDRLGRGPRADLFLGALRARRGELELALQHLGRASVRGAIEETLRLQARGAAFDLLAAEAFAARGRGEQAKFLELGERALAFAWGQSGDPEREPTSKDEQALAGRTADLLLACADAHAREALGRGEPAAARAAGLKAVAACQALVRLPATALARSPAGVRVGARAWASERVRAVVARLGPEVYAGPAAKAEEEYRAARAADQTAGLARMAELYPASPRAADARWALAQAHEQRGLRGEAARELERLVRDWPNDPRRADALARLAVTYEKLRRTTRGRAALDALVAIEPEPRISAPPAEGAPPVEVLARSWAEPLRLRARAGDAEARFAADAAASLDVPLRRTLRTATELSSEGAALAAPGQPWAAPADLVVLRRDGAGRGANPQAPLDALEVRRVSDGAVVAVVPSAPRAGAGARLEPTFVRGPRGALLVVPWSDRLEAWSVEAAAGGPAAAPAWTAPIAPGEGLVALGATPVHEVRGTDEGVLVLTGRNDLVLVDPSSGQERWRRTLARKALGGLTARGGLALCLSTVPAVVDAVRLSDGQPAWSSGAPQPGQAGGQRLSSPVWLDGSTLVYIEDSARVVALEAQTGKRRFTAAASDGAWFLELFPSPDGASFVARTQGAMGAGLRLFEAVTGQELWKDEGWGAQRPGGPPAAVDGPRPTIDSVVVGDDAVYTFRTIARRVEVWAQERTLGKQAWTWQAPIGSQGVPVVIETPTLLIIPRTNGFGQRVTLSVLARGTGRNLETHQLPGRRLLGRGALVRSGVLVVSTDRGLFGLTAVDDEAQARDLARAVQALEDAPGDAEARARVATLLDLGGRGDEALELLSGGLQAEGVQLAAFDRLFASLNALAEAAADSGPRHVDARRMPRPPEIDGELNDWWRPWSSVALRGPRHVQPIQQPPGALPPRWSGDEDLSAELYLGWDDSYLYFALDVADTNLRPYDSEAERWIGDCLLMAIDCLGDGGEVVLGDDVLLSLALTLPKKDKDEEEEKDPEEQSEEEKNRPEGRYFVRRKDDGSGAIYEAAIPWSLFEKNGAVMTPAGGPPPGMEFGFNVVLTDDDGEQDPTRPDVRGALKTLEITPSVLLHAEKSRLWQGFIPGRFARITLR